jgi:hypothetical protein
MTVSEEIQIAAGLGAFATALLAIVSFSISIYERRRDLRWRKAQAARDFIHEMHRHPLTSEAFFFLDWCDAASPPQGEANEKRCVRYDELVAIVGASRAPDLNETARHVLHCLDWLFYYIDRMEQNIRDGLFDFDSVKYCFLPYYEKISKNRGEFDKFSVEHRYLLAPTFWKRFDDNRFWPAAKDAQNDDRQLSAATNKPFTHHRPAAPSVT